MGHHLVGVCLIWLNWGFFFGIKSSTAECSSENSHVIPCLHLNLMYFKTINMDNHGAHGKSLAHISCSFP